MLQLRSSLVGLMLCATTLIAYAHGPTPQKVEEKIEIAAPPEKVWAIVKEFAEDQRLEPGRHQERGHRRQRDWREPHASR